MKLVLQMTDDGVTASFTDNTNNLFGENINPKVLLSENRLNVYRGHMIFDVDVDCSKYKKITAENAHTVSVPITPDCSWMNSINKLVNRK